MAPDEASMTLTGNDGSNEPGQTVDGYDALSRVLRRRDHGVSRRTAFMVFLVGVMVVVILVGLGIAQTLSKLISV